MVLAAQTAAAHELMVGARHQDEALVVEAVYDNGRIPRGAGVQVFDAADALIAEADVDADGFARIPAPDAPDGLRIVVTDGAGHTAEWVLTPADIARQRAQ